jgi:hypothetical protein
LTREGQVSASDEVLARTENTPWDQRNANKVLQSPKTTEAQRIDKSPAVVARRNQATKNIAKTVSSEARAAASAKRMRLMTGGAAVLGTVLANPMLMDYAGRAWDKLFPEPPYDPFGYLRGKMSDKEIAVFEADRRVRRQVAVSIGLDPDSTWTDDQWKLFQPVYDKSKREGFVRERQSW